MNIEEIVRGMTVRVRDEYNEKLGDVKGTVVSIMEQYCMVSVEFHTDTPFEIEVDPDCLEFVAECSFCGNEYDGGNFYMVGHESYCSKVCSWRDEETDAKCGVEVIDKKDIQVKK